MKTYLVSLAIKRPLNFEIEVEAENENEALQQAVETFENGDAEVSNDYVGDDELDIEFPKNHKDKWNPDKVNGVDIEEIKP